MAASQYTAASAHETERMDIKIPVEFPAIDLSTALPLFALVVLGALILVTLTARSIIKSRAFGLGLFALIIIAIRSQHRRKLTETRRKPVSVTESGSAGGGRRSSVAETTTDESTDEASAMDSAPIRPTTYAEYVQSAADRNGSGPLSTPELLVLGVGRSSAYEWPKRYAAEYTLVKVERGAKT